MDVCQFAMFVAIKEIDDQAYHQPNTEAYPIANAQFAHHVQATD